MEKTLIIDTCDYCPFFDNYYYDYAEICEFNLKAVPKVEYKHPIPKWCPLKNGANNVSELKDKLP